MFSVIDILTISIIIVLLFLLLILFQLEKIFTKPRIYLKSALVIIILIVVAEEFILLKQYFVVAWIYPLIILGYFSIYPLVYIYSRDLVNRGNDNKHTRLITISLFPLLILVLVSFIYYPLNYRSKIEFLKLHLWDSNPESREHTLFQYMIYPAYYIQTIFYLIATLKLISAVKKNIHNKPWKLFLVKYLIVYVAAVCLYESLIFINSYELSNTILRVTIEMLLSLIFLSLCLYIGIKQSMIIVQARLAQYADKILETSEVFVQSEQETNASGNIEHMEIIGPLALDKSKKNRLSECEKKEIKEAVENYFDDTKIYLDPNLKLEHLSKKIHITSRRISIVINEVYGTNFNHFINEYRIAEAIKLLSQDYNNIIFEKIFTKVGFNSRSAFNHAFKESTGVSPIDFLKNLTAKQSA